MQRPSTLSKYTVSFFQFGFGFFFPPPNSSKRFMVFFSSIWVLIQEPVQNSPIKPSTTLSVQSKGNKTYNIP